VRSLLKSFLVWLLLLAVPFQGFASATMLVCAPLSSAAQAQRHTAAIPAHDHSAMLASSAASPHHCGGDAACHTSGKTKAGHHADSKCNSCASCCVGAAVVSSQENRINVEPQPFFAIPFACGYVPTVDLALPERPPQAIRA
jgi:hypothetical protein